MDDAERKQMLMKLFDTVSEGYDNEALRFFPESARHMPRMLGLNGNEHVLDVATGTGAAALTLAKALPNGTVTAIDLSEGMLARARTKADREGIRNITFRQMDMSAMEFPDGHFDAASCAFGIFFVEDMEAQASHIAAKLRPGGRLVISTFNEPSFSPLSDIFFKRIESYGIDAPREGRMKLYKAEQCSGLLSGAGLEDINVEMVDISYNLPDAQGWWDILWGAGYRRFLTQLSPEDLERFKAEHMNEVEKLEGKDGIRLTMEILYTTGIKA